MVAIYIMLAISIVVGVCACTLSFFALKKKSSVKNDAITLEQLQNENRDVKSYVDTSIKMNSSMTMGALKAQGDSYKHIGDRVDKLVETTNNNMEIMRKDMYENMNKMRDVLVVSLNEVKQNTAQSINELKASNAQALKEVREDNARSLETVKRDNATQLEKMRETVDEKLSSTLEQRFNQSFKIVNDRLEEINRTFGELQGLQSGITDLNKIFKNVKARGTWGEVSLETLLSQILTNEQYDKQVRIKRGSEDMVDFVIKMPGKGDGEVLLPLDAKFPIEDYARLVEASDKGDVDGIELASKALAKRIKEEAMSIRDKYVNPPKTTDFAVMYLPTEGLYAEVIRREGLVEEIQNKYRVVVCGPTTIAALLNSLQMGFKSVQMEKRSTEIGKLLRSFIVDFDKFAKLLEQTGDKLDKVKKSIGEAENRTNMIRNKLDKVGKLTGDDATVDVAETYSLTAPDFDIDGGEE